MTTTMHLNEISQRLQVDRPSLRRTINRMGLQPEAGELTGDGLKQLIKTYSQRQGRRTEETINAARSMANELGFEQLPIIKTDDRPAKVIREKPARSIKKKAVKNGSWIETVLKSKNFLFVVFLCALSWQVYHTAGVAGRMDGGESWLSNYAFAVAIQFTALLMTIHNGKAVAYLRGFAVIEFLINMAYYRPWHDPATSWDIWSINLLLSFTIAYTIFCYSKLLTTTTE